MTNYNGYRSWNEWNAVLWLSNDQPIESMMRQWADKGYSQIRISNLLIRDLYKDKTPDGAVYTKSAIKEYVKGWFN